MHGITGERVISSCGWNILCYVYDYLIIRFGRKNTFDSKRNFMRKVKDVEIKIN